MRPTPSLYPECPKSSNRILIKDNKKFNNDFLIRYPNCIAKLFRVQFNSTSGKIEQLPGITTESAPIGYPFIFSDEFSPIISKIRQLGYRDNINLFGVGYNQYLHPVTSYSVYEKLKSKIEQVYTQTMEKAILISFNQTSSFTSIFLSNYSQSEWVKQYIDSVIFLSPTFAGFPSLSNLLSQTLLPFTSNTEFKKSIMRMPGLHISLPNYFVYENFTIRDTNNNYKVSQIFEFLKERKKVDDESEKIFKITAEKYLKNPIPEPPIPSLLIISDETAKTAIKPIILINNDDRGAETVKLSTEQACSHWKTAQCHYSNKPSQLIFEYINSRTQTNSPQFREYKSSSETANSNGHITAKSNGYITATNTSGKYADSNYVTSHAVNYSDLTYKGPEGHPNYPLSNAFDGNKNTFYISSTANDNTFNNTIEITFKYTVALEAILYDTAYKTKGQTRTFQGTPTLLYVYTSQGENSPYNLTGIFECNPVYPWEQIQFAFPQNVFCDKLKLEIADLTPQSLTNPNSAEKNPTIGLLTFVRHVFYTAEPIYSSIVYTKEHVIPNDGFTYTSTPSKAGYGIENAFDGDSSTYYISESATSETSKNFIEVNFNQVETLEGIIYDQTFVGTSEVAQGFPTSMNIYSKIGSGTNTLVMKFMGSSNLTWKTICFHFEDLIECDTLLFEFIKATPQTIEGDSTSVVIAGLYFARFHNKTKYTRTNFNLSSEAYLNTYSVNPSKFSYLGVDGLPQYPIKNAFDGDPNTFYISSLNYNDMASNQLIFTFTETVSLTDIVYDLSYKTVSNKLQYHGCPSLINVYSKFSEDEQDTLTEIFIGKPVSPMKRIQLHFSKVIDCKILILEFGDVSMQQFASPYNKNLMIGNLYFVPVHESNVTQISGASDKYTNNSYVYSNMINKSEFSFTIDEAAPNNPESNIFDLNASSYYAALVPSNNSYHTMMEINFNDQVLLEAFLMDTNHFTAGSLRSFYGFPTGIKVYASIGNDPYQLITFFIGDPVYPWTRIQFVFPDLVCADKLKFEFLNVIFNNLIYKSNTLVINELYLIRGYYPATPTPSYSPSISPSPSATPSPSFSPTPSQSVSPSISPSPSTSPSLSFSPSISPSETVLPSQIPITDVCTSGSHCSIEGSVENQVSVAINATVFNKIQSNENGGALFLKNAGLTCSTITFRGCETKAKNENNENGGGGGGIYIKNEIEISSSISLNEVNFTNCKANYGGAVYIYSVSIESTVNIIKCFFSTNQATSSTSSISSIRSEFVGGSAIFITTKSSYISDCTFYKNVGENQVKIENEFQNVDSSLLQQNDQHKTSNILRYSKFVIERQSQSSLYYNVGENGVICYVMNSIFIGDLMPGSYHINGKASNSYSPKLIVVRCKFSSDYSRAFSSRSENKNEYIVIQFQKQTFDYTEKDDGINKDVYGYSIFGVVAVLALVIVIVARKQCDSKQIINNPDAA